MAFVFQMIYVYRTIDVRLLGIPEIARPFDVLCRLTRVLPGGRNYKIVLVASMSICSRGRIDANRAPCFVAVTLHS